VWHKIVSMSSPLRLLQLATVVGPLLLLAVAGASLWTKQRSRAAEDVQRSLDLLVQHVSRLVESQELMLTYADEFVRGMTWSEIANSRTVQQQLHELTARAELTRNIVLIDDTGTVRATSQVFLVAPIDMSDRDYYRVLRDHDERLVFGERIKGRIFNEDLIPLARRRTGEGFDGVVVAGITVGKFQPFLEGLRRDRQTAVSLIRADGRVLIRAPDTEPMTLPTTSGFMQSMPRADRGVYEATSAVDGVPRIFGYSRVGDWPLFVSYAVGTRSITRAWYQEMAFASAVTLAIVVAGFVLATQAVHRQAMEQQWREALTREVGTRTIELRQSEERSKLLAAEVDHRAKNTLAIVQVLLRQTRASSVEAYARAAQGRVAALARAHTLLSQSRWAGAELSRLIEEESAPYRRSGLARVSMVGPKLLLEPKDAQALAMVLHELATNAAKYGALSVPGGEVGVQWSVDREGQLLLRWTESNGPPVQPPSRLGLGSQVIERSVRDQLDGTVQLDWHVEGLICTITLPPGRAKLDTAETLARQASSG
jgi:two-component sensor histidine kinase